MSQYKKGDIVESLGLGGMAKGIKYKIIEWQEADREAKVRQPAKILCITISPTRFQRYSAGGWDLDVLITRFETKFKKVK